MPDISELNKLLAEALESINEESLVEKIMSKKRARKLRAIKRAKLKQQAAQEKEKENDVIDAEVVDSEGDTEDNDREYKQLVVYNEKISGGENQQKDYSDAFKKFIKEINGLVTKYGEIFANAEKIWQQAGKDKPCPKEAYELYRQGLDGFKQELDTLLSTTLSQDAEKMAEEELTFIETQMMATSRFLEEYEKAITASNPQDIKLPAEVGDELQLPANPEEETSTELQVQSKTKKEPEARNWITFEQFEKMTKDPKVVWKQVTENEAELAKLSWGEFIKKNNPLSWFTEGMLGFIKSPVVRDFIKTLAYSNPLTAFIYDGKLGSLGLDGIKNSISKIGEYRDKRKAAKEKVAKDKKKDKEFYNEKGIPKDLSKLSISELRAEFYGNNHLVNLLNTAYNHPETDNNDAHELEQLSDKINKQFMKGNNFKKLEDVNRTEVVKNFTSLCTKLNEIADYQHWDNKKSFEKAKEEAEANKENRAKAVDLSKKKKENKKVKAINDLIKRYKNAKDKKYGEQEIVDAILRQYDDITSKQAQDYIDKWNKNNKHESYNITKNLNKLLEDSRSIKENKMNLTSLDEIKQDGLTVFMPSGIQATLFLEDDNVLVQYPNLQVDKYTKKDFQNIMDEGIFIFNDMPQNFPQIMESYSWSVSELELGDSGFDSPEEAYQNAKMCLEDSDYEVGDFDGEGFSVYDPGNEEMGYLPFDGYGVIESDEDDMDESALMESEEPEIDSHKFTFKVTDTNIQLKSDWYETIIDIDGELDQTQLKSDIEDTLDFESTDFFEGEGEITGTEIVGFKYDEDEKRGEFEFNIFYEPIDFEESLNENGLFKKELTPLPSKDASFKEGDIVTINGVKGEIIKVKPMKMSDTCTYQIKLEDGKTIWRYEEEINESLNEDIKTEYAIIKFLKKYGFATQEDLYNNIGAQPFVVDNTVKELLKQNKIKFDDTHGKINDWKLNESLNEDANSIATELRNGNKSGTDKELGQWKLKTSLDSNWENLTELVKTLILFNIADEVENGNLEMKDFAQYFDNSMDLTKEDLQALDMFTEEEIDTMFSTNGYLECFITYEIQHLEDPSEDIEESLIDKLSKKGIIREFLVKEFKENNFQAYDKSWYVIGMDGEQAGPFDCYQEAEEYIEEVTGGDEQLRADYSVISADEMEESLNEKYCTKAEITRFLKSHKATEVAFGRYISEIRGTEKLYDMHAHGSKKIAGTYDSFDLSVYPKGALYREELATGFGKVTTKYYIFGVEAENINESLDEELPRKDKWPAAGIPYEGFIWDKERNSYSVHAAFYGGQYVYLGSIMFDYYDKNLNLVKVEVRRQRKGESEYTTIFNKRYHNGEKTLEEMQDEIESVIKKDINNFSKNESLNEEDTKGEAYAFLWDACARFAYQKISELAKSYPTVDEILQDAEDLHIEGVAKEVAQDILDDYKKYYNESLNEEDEIKYYWGKTDQNKTLLVAGKSSKDAITNSKKFFTPELVFNSPEECDKEYDEIIDLKENIEEEKTLDFLGINQNDFTSKEELIKYIEENTDYDVLSSGDYWLNIIDRTQNDGETIQINLERKMREAYEKTKRKEGDVFKALKNKKKEYLTPEFKTELLNSLDRIAREFPNVKVRQQATTFMNELGLQEYYDTKKVQAFIKKNLKVLNTKVNEELEPADIDDIEQYPYCVEIRDEVDELTYQADFDNEEAARADFDDHKEEILPGHKIELLHLVDSEGYEVLDSAINEQFKEKKKGKKKKKLDELNKEVNKMEELKEDCYKVYNSIENRECGTFNSWNEVEDFLNKEWGDYKASMAKENPEFGTDDDKYNFFGNYDMVTTQLPVAVVPAEIEVDVEATPEPVAEPVPEEPVIPQVCPNCGNEPCSCEKETCELCVEEPENCDGCADIEVPEDAEEIDMDAIIDEMCMTKLPDPKEVLDKDGKQEKKNKKEEDKNEDFKDNMGMLTDINDLDFPDALQNAVDTKEDGSLYRISDVAKMVSELKAEIDSLKSEFKTALDELKQGIKDDVKDIRTDVTSKLDNTDDKISELTAEEEDLEALEEPIEEEPTEEPAEETEEPTEEENTEDEELEEALKEMRKNPIYSQIKETFESNTHPKKLISIATVAQKIRENYGTDIKNDFTYELIRNICTKAPEFKEHVVDAETEKRTLKESMLGKATKWISGGLMGILAQEKENKNKALIESYRKEAVEKAEKQNEDANEIKKEIDKLNAEGKNDKIKATIDVMSDTPEEKEEAIDYAIQKVQESNANDLLRRLKDTSRTAAFSNLNIKG